ncbi:MAG: undecaprenyl-diphosphate phosphatase [Kiritimatiellales bacterium]|nr:undecaprenyl-diphosphate phosphatase [Kiritimatiellales bacterium]
MTIWITVLLLGIIEGFTEFLPISSTGHLILAECWLKLPSKEFSDLFNIIVQLGAILAVVMYFYRRLAPWAAPTPEARREVWQLWLKVIVGVLPAIGIGLLLGDMIEEHLMHPGVVASALIIGGILLILIERRQHTIRFERVADLTYRFVLAIGFVQCLAMLPGTSRSAATILGALMLGASRKAAAEYSFFLAIVTMGAASAYALLKAAPHFSSIEWGPLAVGFAMSFLVAYASIAFLMHYIQRHDFKFFGYYRIVLGIFVLTALWMHWIHA